MKTYLAALVVLCMALATSAQTKSKVLTTDSMTGLPLSPATDAGRNVGNAPDPLPESNICKSKLQGQFYLLYNTTTDAVAAWYSQNLKGFKMAKGTHAGRAQVVFSKPDGTVLVIVTGNHESPGAFSVAYERYTPGLSEKTVAGVPQGNIVCP
ncbi:MAG TPA: hypothetical protein VGJ06_02625 [Candidatus Acidoferrum sp.]